MRAIVITWHPWSSCNVLGHRDTYLSHFNLLLWNQLEPDLSWMVIRWLSSDVLFFVRIERSRWSPQDHLRILIDWKFKNLHLWNHIVEWTLDSIRYKHSKMSDRVQYGNLKIIFLETNDGNNGLNQYCGI